MKKNVLKFLIMLFICVGVFVACNKDTTIQKIIKVNNSLSEEVQDRSSVTCCGTVHIFGKDKNLPILPVPFQVWWLDTNHSWKVSTCYPASTKNVDLVICHNKDEALTMFLYPCFPSQPIPEIPELKKDPTNWNAYPVHVAKTTSCGEYYYNNNCMHWYWGELKNYTNPPPIPVIGVAKPKAYNLEISLCCINQ